MTSVEIHRDLALLAGVATGLVAAVALGGLGTARLDRRWLDRSILAALVVLVAAVASGIVLVGSGNQPAEALHYLYALAALVALPIARAWGGPSAGRHPALILIGAAVLAGLVVRLFQTGT